jgi:hypothetical protein
MPEILNYTTTIAAEKTLGEIHHMLVQAGARQVSVDYDALRQPTAVSFVIVLPFGEASYWLPANRDAVLALLERQCNQGQVRRALVTPGQASRVGWRIIKDWLEAQLAIIDAGLVTLEQVMLPYAIVDRTDGRKWTFYDAWRQHQGRLAQEAQEGSPVE